jgi:hypothetical protein
MADEARAKLLKSLSRTYGRAQLDSIVRATLGNSLEFYAIGSDLPSIIDKLLSDLEKRLPELWRFLLTVRENTRRPDLRSAIDGYLEIAKVEENVYEALVVLDEPFVNRHILRRKLRELFETPNRRVLVVRGNRVVGKSHSKWLIQHVSQSIGVEMIYVDLRDTVEDIVWQVVNDMSLPPNEFRDRLAQLSTVSKGFVSALRGFSRQMNDQHWCLVLDGYDRAEVADDVRVLVDTLLGEVAKVQMGPIRLVLLGYRDLPYELRSHVIEEEVLPIAQPDVERFLRDLTALLNTTGASERCTQICDSIFDGLAQPLDEKGMITMTSRLRAKVIDIQEMC